MQPFTYNITIEQGEDWSRDFRFYDGPISNGVYKNLSGCNFYAQCRSDWDKDLVFDFEIAYKSYESGLLGLSVTGTKTSDLCRIGNFKWDLFTLDTEAKKHKYVKGSLTINGSQTKF